MQDSWDLRRVVRFGAFEVDLKAREFRKNGLKISLQEQPFKVLALLLEHPGEVVGREELRQTLWPSDTFVDFEDGLNTAVRKLRQALGDSSESPRFIETLPRVGYRFIAPVEPLGQGAIPSSVSSARTTAPPLKKRWITALGAVALIALAATSIGLNVGGLRERLFGRADSGPIRSLAVLPLENLSGDPSQEYFADGMTDELITELGKVSTLRVISRTSIMQYKGAKKPLPEIARELNVDAVVEGTVVQSGGRVRITAQLIYAPSDQHIWAERYERDMRDVLNLQSDVAQDIADEVMAQLKPQERPRHPRARPVDPAAYDLYLKAINEEARWANRALAIGDLQQATEKDPGFAKAYAELADYYTQLGNAELLAPQEAYPNARVAAMKALEIDNTLASPHSALALIKYRFDWDWSGADGEFKRALELEQNNALTHAAYAGYLILMGRFDEATTQIRRAQELDPLYPPYSFGLGDLFYCSRQYDRAITQLRQAEQAFHLENELAAPHTLLGKAYKEKGMFAEAIAEDQRAAALLETPLYLAMLGDAYGAAGRKADALRVLSRLKELSKQEYVSPYDIALVYLGLGDKDLTFAWLEKAYQARSNDMSNLKQDPIFDSVRGDRRFQDLLRRMGFST